MLLAVFEEERLGPGHKDYPFTLTGHFSRITHQYEIDRQSDVAFAFLSPTGKVHTAPDGLPSAAVEANDPEEGDWVLRVVVGPDGELVGATMRVIGRR